MPFIPHTSFRERESEVEVIPHWPPNSPDLSPIENFWDIIMGKLREKYTSTVGKLEAALHRASKGTPAEMVRNLAYSLRSSLNSHET